MTVPHRTTLTSTGATVFHATGPLTFPSASALSEQLLSLIDNGVSRLVVDLSEVELIDSSGIGALIAGLKAARRVGGDLRLTAPPTAVVTILRMMNLINILAIADSADSAFPHNTA